MRLSYSGWKTHDQCPAKFKYSYIEKLPRGDSGPAAARGSEIHNSVDVYMQGRSEEIHEEIRKHYGQWMMQMREYRVQPELKFGVDEDWQPTDFEDPNAAWRGMIDLPVLPEEGETELDWYEWKTGNIYSDHQFQSQLYGTIALVLHETANIARVHNVYFDKKKTETREYLREDLEGYKFMWDQRRHTVMDDKIHPANPGWYCRYCDYGVANNGPCPF